MWRTSAGAHAGAAAMGTTRVKTATADDVLNPILAMSPQKDGAYVTRSHNGVWWCVQDFQHMLVLVHA